MQNHKLLILISSLSVILAGVFAYRMLQSGNPHAASPNPTVASDATAPGPPRTTKRFTSAERASQESPSSGSTGASKVGDHHIQIPREVSLRVLEKDGHPIASGRLPGKLTWSKDGLALLGLDESQQARLQEALDQASARAFEVMKRTIKTLPSEEEGDSTFEIPDWSKEEGVAIRAELTKAIESVVSAADAKLLMKLANNDNQDEPLNALFGEGHRKVIFSRESSSYTFLVTKDGSTSRHASSFGVHDFTEEWMDLYKLPAEVQASLKASYKAQEESERMLEEILREGNAPVEEAEGE